MALYTPYLSDISQQTVTAWNEEHKQFLKTLMNVILPDADDRK